MKKGKIMRTLILIVLLFSLQILQGQVSAELLWEKNYKYRSILSISHDNKDSILYVVSGLSTGSSFDSSNITKLDNYNGNSLITSNNLISRKVCLSPLGNPLFSLDISDNNLCKLDPNSLNIVNSCIAANKDFNYTGFQVFQSKDLTDFYLTSNYLKLGDTFKFNMYNFQNKSFDNSIELNLGQYTGRRIINFTKTKNKDLYIFCFDSDGYYNLAVYSNSGKLLFRLQCLDILNAYNNYNLESGILCVSSDEKYMFYCKGDNIYSLDLNSFEVKLISKTNLLDIQKLTLSIDDKYMLITTNNGIFHYDFTSNNITKLSNDNAQYISFTDNNYSFYAIIGKNILKKYRLNLTTSINEEEKETNLSISPNPTSDFINIVGVEPETSLKLTNILGETVWSGIGVKQISTQAMPNGTYFLKTTKGNQIKSQKVLVWR